MKMDLYFCIRDKIISYGTVVTVVKTKYNKIFINFLKANNEIITDY